MTSAELIADTPAAHAPAKDAPKKKTGAPRSAIGKKDPKVSRKRGPPRPHRKLAQDLLEARISKLQKRIDRTKGQLEDAQRHIEGYEKESKYREAEKNE